MQKGKQKWRQKGKQTEEEKEQDRQAQLQAAQQDRELLKKVWSIAHALHAYLYRNDTKALVEVETQFRKNIKDGNNEAKSSKKWKPCFGDSLDQIQKTTQASHGRIAQV